jgi:uracil-DNA glycosylase
VRTIGARSIRLLPLFHPAAALYTPSTLQTLRDDFARLPELLARPEPPQPETEVEPRPEPTPEPEDRTESQPQVEVEISDSHAVPQPKDQLNLF